MTRRRLLLPMALVLALGATVGADEEPLSREAVLRGLSSPTFAGRRVAVWAARDHPDPAYLEKLLVMARRDPHPNVRAWALEALGRYEDQRIVPLLHAALAEDDNPFPKDMALESLGRLRAPQAFETLVANLAAGSRGTAVMRGLGALGDARAFDVILRFWDAHAEDPYVAPAAPGILVALDAKRGRDACLQRFETAPSAFRHRFEAALVEAGGAEVREVMVRHLDGEDESVRHSAIRVMGRVGDATTDGLLLARFRKASEDRAVLARSLGTRAAKIAVPDLAQALADEGTVAGTRAAIAEALGALGDQRGVDPLLAALRGEKDVLAAVQIAVALGRIGDERASDALEALAGDTRISHQPEQISAIWGYPWNCRVGDAAVWAWATIQDGRPPFPYQELSGFRDPPATNVRDALAALRRRLPESDG